MDKPLLAALMALTPEQAAAAPEISEGLENRILANAMESVSRADLILRVKTRRYPYTRISRALCHLATGTARAMLRLHHPVNPFVPTRRRFYARSFRARSQGL